MEIYRDEFFEIFKANFNYPIVETPLGLAVKMPAKDAFIYSSITGAGYFENPVYPFTPKGLLKLFYNAFNYKFVSGIFDNGVLKNTPHILSTGKSYLFNGDKYIVPVEFESEDKLLSMLKDRFADLEGRENYIIQRIETSKQGNGMEPFMEYLTAEYFKNHGFIVENQIPLAHSIGSPDFAGYGLGEMISKINHYGFLSGNGFHMIELSMIRDFKEGSKDSGSTVTHDFIVGEAKTGTSQMTKQLEKYLNTGLFDQGFEIHPAKANPAKKYFGVISLDDKNKITISLPEEKFEPTAQLSKEEYTIWLNNYVKFYLIANFTNDELKRFYFDTKGEEINKEADLVSFVVELSAEAILDKIKTL